MKSFFNFINAIVSHSFRLRSLIDSRNPQTNYATYTQNLLKDFDWYQLKELNETQSEDFYLNKGSPLIYYLDLYFKTLENERNHHLIENRFLSVFFSPF